MNNKDIIKHLISPEHQIKSAIKKLSMLGRLRKNKFFLVVGKRRNILGTVTDGDIRRGLLQNYNINEKVEKIYKYTVRRYFYDIIYRLYSIRICRSFTWR